MIIRRFAQVTDMLLQIEGLVEVNPCVVSVSERFTTEPAILMDVMGGNVRSLC